MFVEGEERPPVVVLELPTSPPSNFDDVEKLIHHALYNEARVAPEETPLVMTESSFPNNSVREKLTQIMFETFNVPMLLVVPTSVLALRHFGLETGLSIHSGETGTEIVPVINSAPVSSAALDYPVTGSHITGYLVDVLVKRTGDTSSPAMVSIAKDLKASKCFTSLDPSTQPPVKVQYELPDGAIVDIDDAAWQCVEGIFYPEYIGVADRPLVASIVDVIERCHRNVQPALFQNIVLSGGNFKFAGFAERLRKDLLDYVSDDSVKIDIKFDREKSNRIPWLGASTVGADLNNISKFFTHEQYDELGPSGIHTIGSSLAG